MFEIYEKDNWDVLRGQESASVDLIYSDILYGTGRDFGTYKDLRSNRFEIEEHYEKHLIEMKRVLKFSGSIYLQMDTRINHWMRCLMDDVFGHENFRNEIVWYYDNGGGRTRRGFNKKHDIILYYSVSENYIYNVVPVPYKETSGYAKGGIVNRGKKYLPNVAGKNPDDVFVIPIINPMSKERVGYPTQKPKELIRRLVLASSNEGDVIADYYLGSGTTGVACIYEGFRFIGIELEKEFFETATARINQAEKIIRADKESVQVLDLVSSLKDKE